MAFPQIYDNGALKPYLNESCNALLLQGSSNQLKFQQAEAGNYLALNVAANPANNTVVTFTDPGSASVSIQYNISGSLETKTRTLTSADSNKILLLNSAVASSTYSLPAPSVAIGLHFTFVVSGTLANPVVIASTGLNLNGSAVYSDAKTATAIVAQTSQLKVILSGSSAIGDRVDIYSNGTVYAFSAQVAAATTLSFSTS